MVAVIPSTAVGVFKDRGQAERAVEELLRAGFTQDQVGVLARHPEQPAGAPPAHATHAAEGGITGVVAGGAFGGILGAVAAGLIPGVGPVIGAGILAATAGGVAAGAAAGGLVGSLVGLAVPEEDARYYQSEFETGRTLVTVKADGRYGEAVEILRSHGAYGKGSPLV
jgi:hypothetical protein